MRSSPTYTAPSSMRVTMESSRTSTPSASSCCCALRDSSSSYAASRRLPPSIRMIRAARGSKLRKSRLSVWCAISAKAPAISTPVGPPPITTKVSSARRSSGSVTCSACSKASRKRRRISVASSMVFIPGAMGAHSPCPKYWSTAPAARTRKS